MADKYDEAIAYLTEHPEEIRSAWYSVHDGSTPHMRLAHCLFQHCTPSGNLQSIGDCPVGCLTIVRSGSAPAWTNQLTESIMLDDRLPDNEIDICVEHLPVFAEWQRRLDKELNRT